MMSRFGLKIILVEESGAKMKHSGASVHNFEAKWYRVENELKMGNSR